MKRLVVCFLLVAPSAYAQFPIHNYPYANITAYNSPTEWPFLSAQCHLRVGNSNLDPTNTPQLMSPAIAHTHVEANVPVYAEVKNNFNFNFDVMLFDAQAVLADDPISASWNGGPLISNFTWDSHANLNGVPNGLVKFTGHATLDFSKATGSGFATNDIPKHGWFTMRLSVTTFFNNGNRTVTTLNVPLFSVIDTSVPEQFFPQDAQAVGATCSPGSAFDNPADAIGNAEVAFYKNYLPILSPLNVALPDVVPSTYGYGTTQLPNGTSITRFDMDLHNGNPGKLIQSVDGPPATGGGLNSPFDPAILGPGTHKVATLWQQDTRNGVAGVTIANEQASALLVVIVNVGGTAPPPPTWTNLPGLFQQEDQDPTKYRLCPDSTGLNCVTYMKMQ